MRFGSSDITIGNYQFIDRCNSAEINMSWKELAQTAKISLPNIKRLLEKNIKVGDVVLIKLGYNDTIVEEFRGYVSSVSPGTPVVFECMDEMWIYKQSTVTKAWRTTTVKDVLEYMIPSATIEVPEINLTSFRVDQVTVYDALKELKEKYGLVIYFREGVLFCGLAYQETNLGEVKYHFQQNIPLQNNSLIFRSANDVKVKVKAISMMPNNTSIKVEVGDADGEQRTLHFYNLTEAELKAQATDKINLLKFDGYRGDLTAFGVPVSKFGMAAELIDDKYPERAGKYFIDSVRTTYSVSAGYRRVVQLGRKANGSLLKA